MEMARRIRVLWWTNATLHRQALRTALEAYPNIQIAGEASDGEEAVVCAAKLQPTVVVIDINMQKMDGITATRLIEERNCRNFSCHRTLSLSERLPVIRHGKSRGV